MPLVIAGISSSSGKGRCLIAAHTGPLPHREQESPESNQRRRSHEHGSTRRETHSDRPDLDGRPGCFKRAEDDGEFTIPLDPGSLQPADPDAVYTLSESGKTVTGVDYVSVWTIHPAAEKIK